MQFSILALISLLPHFTTAHPAVGAAEVDGPNDAATSSITLAFFPSTCAHPHSDTDATSTMEISPISECLSLPHDAVSLRVKGVKGEGLKYNSLRLYPNADCSGGWTLEPATSCSAKKEGCACSEISAYKSVKVVVTE